MVRRHLLSTNKNHHPHRNGSHNTSPTSSCGFGDLDDLVNSKLMISASPEDLKQESLSEILAHGEVQELRDWFHRTIAKLQGLERERDYYEGKCQALTQVLQVTQDANETTALLQTSSLKVAELSLEVETLRHELQQNQSKIAKLEQEKEANRAMLVELSTIVHAFAGRTMEQPPVALDVSRHRKKKNVPPASPPSSSPIKTTTKDSNSDDIITPAMAAEMTIRGLKAQVEALEDERGELVSDMVSLQTACDEMRKENEARALKIAALEKQFHSINQARELVVAQLIKKGRIDSSVSSRNLMTGMDDDDASMVSTSSKRSLRWPRVPRTQSSSSASVSGVPTKKSKARD